MASAASPYERLEHPSEGDEVGPAQNADQRRCLGVTSFRRAALLSCSGVLVLGVALLALRQHLPTLPADPETRADQLSSSSPRWSGNRSRLPRRSPDKTLPSTKAAPWIHAKLRKPRKGAPQDWCEEVTGGTCRIYGCNGDRGPTYCARGRCLCRPNYCARNGKCISSSSSCFKQTYGTCTFFPCRASRGPTKCVDRQCICSGDYCASNGACVRRDTCTSDTGGTCRIWECEEFRGPTRCDKGVCRCHEGLCAENGLCILKTSDFQAFIYGVNASHPEFPAPRSKAKGGEKRDVHSKLSSKADALEIGLAISGGGSRSLSFTMGVLKSLEALGLMEHFDAISAVSGGAWAAALYMFAYKSGVSDQDLLHYKNPFPPEGLTIHALKQPPPRMGNVVTVGEGDFMRRQAATQNLADMLWIDFVSQIILEPFGLDDRHSLKFMAGSDEQVADIKRRNPDLKGFDFLVPRQDRSPVFIMNGAIMSPSGFKNGQDSVVSLQMGPDWTGSPFYPNGKTQNMAYHLQLNQHDLHDLHGMTIGGGFVESFAFGSAAPAHQYGSNTPARMGAPGDPFTLADAVGISSCALAAALASYAAVSYVNPDLQLWPVTPDGQREMKYQLGDGGIIENGGLLPLLQRGAKKVVWLINTDTGLHNDFNWCGDAPKAHNFDPNASPSKITNQLSDKFGHGISSVNGYLAHNQVFKKSKFPEVGCDLQKLKAKGVPLVLRKKLMVVPNAWWGIKGGYEVDITFVYLERVWGFEHAIKDQALRDELSKGYYKKGGLFNNYPFFKTIFQNGAEIIQYNPEQVNILAALAEYTVLQNKELFEDVLTR